MRETAHRLGVESEELGAIGADDATVVRGRLGAFVGAGGQAGARVGGSGRYVAIKGVFLPHDSIICFSH